MAMFNMVAAASSHQGHGRIASSEKVSTLESNARSLLLSSIRTIGDGTAKKFIYPTACDNVDGIVDSTATLIAARTLSKIGRSDISWDFLRTIFSGQGSNGFLPKFVYLNHTMKDDEQGDVVLGAKWEEFIGPYPGPKLFPSVPKEYVPSSYFHYDETKVKIWSSNTLSASPHHATTVLDVFYMSNQTNADVDNLLHFYTKLRKWHDYLHAQVITNCRSSSSSSTASMQTTDSSPCLTVLHPWETEIEMSSILWEYALENVTKLISEKSWTSSFDIPAEVKSSFDYPGDDKYNTLLYLLECLSDHSTGENLIMNDNKFSIYSACPFQMIDVGFASALSKADQDLQQIGQILVAKNRISQPSSYFTEMERYQLLRSKRMLYGLWEDSNGIFLNRIVNLTMNASSGVYQSNNDTHPLTLPAGANYAAFWEALLNSTMIGEMSSHLLQHSGQFSHYCGEYPLWSMGGCGESDSPMIPVLLNYRVSKGLRYNNEFGLAQFLQTSSINVVCGLPNSGEPNLTECMGMQRFAWAFNGTTQLPIGSGEGECGLTSTLTAAIVLDFLHPDKLFKYESEPPISSSSVIVLIAMELVIAFSVGLTCLLLSLNLMRRATVDDEGDAFVRILREQQQPDEEILVRSPREDSGDIMTNNLDAPNDAGSSSLEFITRLFPSLFGTE